ncbi:hypothetical protein EGW08_020430 [Elysia chlorotica]|uniref:Uncharacterized protein n=1 Tax=Elysia chlorotica TaxID=188477 RepID=A0A3S1H425_ELYCH|nr:hypothetical protein EGW08_020430 [Elysia chlorotica]
MVKLTRACSFHSTTRQHPETSRDGAATRKVSSLAVFPSGCHTNKFTSKSSRQLCDATSNEHVHKVRFYLGESDLKVDSVGTSHESPSLCGTTDNGGESKICPEKSGGIDGPAKVPHSFFTMSDFKELFQSSKKKRTKSKGSDSDLSNSDMGKTAGGSFSMEKKANHPPHTTSEVDHSLSSEKCPISCTLKLHDDALTSAPVLSISNRNADTNAVPPQAGHTGKSVSVRSTPPPISDRSSLAPDDHHLLSRVVHMGHVIGRGLRRASSTRRSRKGRTCETGGTDKRNMAVHDDVDDDGEEEEFFPHSFADESCLKRGDSFMRRHFPHLHKSGNNKSVHSHQNSVLSDRHHQQHHHHNHQHHHSHHSLREYVLEVLHLPHRLRRTRKGFSHTTFR